MDIGQNSTLCASPLSDVEAGSGIAGRSSDETRVPLCYRQGGTATLPLTHTVESGAHDTLLGRFALLEKIGAGSFGEVWKARDALLDRHVAIKIAATPDADRLTPGMLEEARLAAQLRHPNIVRVHELDAQGNVVFIVSDLIEGMTLAEWRSACPPSERAALQMTEKIARALHHAHQRGVVHRDLKPGNVMVGHDGEPCLVDFGLGLRSSDNPDSAPGPIILGTPLYMSPEQACGASHRVDHRADVYSLGVILFELLTGRLPASGTTQEVLNQRRSSHAPRPRAFNPAVSLDLDQICFKCLQPLPADRYATALDLADDLARCLSGHPVHARPIGLLRRAGRMARRHPAYSAIVMVLCGLLAFAGIISRRNDAAQSQLVASETTSSVLKGSMRLQQQINLARSPQYMQAVVLADGKLGSARLPAHEYYDLACIYALACASAERDSRLAEGSRRERIDDCRGKAYDMLDQARAGGYFDSPDCRTHLTHDAHLNFLRTEPEFVSFSKVVTEERT